jgi:hypothetical protein
VVIGNHAATPGIVQCGGSTPTTSSTP